MAKHFLETTYEIYDERLQGSEKVVVCEDAEGLDLTEIRCIRIQKVTDTDGVVYVGERITDRIVLQEEAIPLLIEALQKRLSDIKKVDTTK